MSVKTEMVPSVVKYPKKGGWNYYNQSLSTDTVSDSDGLAGMELSYMHIGMEVQFKRAGTQG